MILPEISGPAPGRGGAGLHRAHWHRPQRRQRLLHRRQDGRGRGRDRGWATPPRPNRWQPDQPPLLELEQEAAGGEILEPTAAVAPMPGAAQLLGQPFAGPVGMEGDPTGQPLHLGWLEPAALTPKAFVHAARVRAPGKIVRQKNARFSLAAAGPGAPALRPLQLSLTRIGRMPAATSAESPFSWLLDIHAALPSPSQHDFTLLRHRSPGGNAAGPAVKAALKQADEAGLNRSSTQEIPFPPRKCPGRRGLH